jgi:hypothetical protein
MQLADPKESGERGDKKRGKNRRNTRGTSLMACGLGIHTVQMRQMLHKRILANLWATSKFFT